jgi:hypothetical protein
MRIAGACAQILTGGWYPFELNDRLDQAVAAEMGLGDKRVREIGGRGRPPLHRLREGRGESVTSIHPTKGAEHCEYVCEWG